ncbi:dihydroneopterin aldolase [Priestia megaterium]|nr:dihydroneopterin aldolase [Priestia megaterium]
MDKIYVNNMRFYGYHGVFKEENKLGQRFNVDLVVELDLEQAGQTDDLTYTVSYADLYSTCQEIVEKRTFKLVETVAETIASELLKNYGLIQTCTVKIYKPDPPINGYYDSVAVEIKRSR